MFAVAVDLMALVELVAVANYYLAEPVELRVVVVFATRYYLAELVDLI